MLQKKGTRSGLRHSAGHFRGTTMLQRPIPNTPSVVHLASINNCPLKAAAGRLVGWLLQPRMPRHDWLAACNTRCFSRNPTRRHNMALIELSPLANPSPLLFSFLSFPCHGHRTGCWWYCIVSLESPGPPGHSRMLERLSVFLSAPSISLTAACISIMSICSFCSGHLIATPY